MNEDTWLEVDDTGHVPGVAAELPPSHKVLLDAAGNLMAIVPVEAVPVLEEAVAEQRQESGVSVGSPEAQQMAQQESVTIAQPAPETSAAPAVGAADVQQAPVAEPVTSVQPDAQTSIQSSPENDASLAVGGTDAA